MKKKQLAVLSTSSLIIWTVGNGLLPVLPVYASKLGASPESIGYYLAITYLALASGTLTAGWLSDRFQHRKEILIVTGVIAVPATFLMSRATSIWELTLFTAALWLLGGIGLVLASIITGLLAEKSQRGKIFGILALTGGLGSLIGGLSTGTMADLYGFPTMLAIFSLVIAIWPFAGLFFEDTTKNLAPSTKEVGTRKASYGLGLILLFAANLLTEIGFFIGRLGTSLEMNHLGYVSAAISSTIAVGAVVGIPLTATLGTLSDMVDRRLLLGLCFLSTLTALLILSVSVLLWQFYIAASLLAIFATAGAGVGSALVTDIADSRSLGRSLSILSSTGWIGGIAGFAATGWAFTSIGAIPTFFIGALLPAIGISLLIPIAIRKTTGPFATSAGS